MKVIEASAEIVTQIDGGEVLKHLERCGRVCYKSEAKITEGSAAEFVRALIERGHESVLEHYQFTAKIVCDRGVSHEIVRHRMASYSQESTRYCNYSNAVFGNEITVVKPCYLDEKDPAYFYWSAACKSAEKAYFEMLSCCRTPQEARAVLPNSLKTEVMMTANLREWRHFFDLRCDRAAHPQMREVATKLLGEAHERIPVVFDDIWWRT